MTCGVVSHLSPSIPHQKLAFAQEKKTGASHGGSRVQRTKISTDTSSAIQSEVPQMDFLNVKYRSANISVIPHLKCKIWSAAYPQNDHWQRKVSLASPSLLYLQTAELVVLLSLLVISDRLISKFS